MSKKIQKINNGIRFICYMSQNKIFHVIHELTWDILAKNAVVMTEFNQSYPLIPDYIQIYQSNFLFNF
jgi:hypothetical protein